MLRMVATAFLLYTLPLSLLAQESMLSKSDMVKLDFKILAEKKQHLQAHKAAYTWLLKKCDSLLSFQPVSVMQKAGMPPSGDKHDYMSIAPYSWPDTTKPGGVPYINRDGQVNPEVLQYQDKTNITRLCTNVYLLGLAYYYSGEKKYAAHVAELLRAWFLDPATKMNPNLNFGQAVKGVTTGRPYGMIETRNLVFLIDGLDLIKTSGAWSGQDQAGMQDWFRQFLQWAQTSKLGREEMNGTNNHGVWYDAQTLSMALFLDSADLASKIIARAEGRLDRQMDSTGFFPLEMKRTTSLHYSVFILNAFYVVAQLAEERGSDFWNVRTPSGKSLRQAFEVLLPYMEKEKTWTGPQIEPFEYRDAVPILLRSIEHYGCTSCRGAISRVDEGDLLIDLL